ncbi:MAG: hypothetical protein NUV97_00955 [archaeon]|nr:hypothetical protein [archaeon]MCR4323471.1 hypothetical protein [Nanoarchaeota archaeon]
MVKRVVKRTITETTSHDGTKKTVVKEHAPKNISSSKPKKKRMTASEREELLIENFVGLQHAMTNLSIKFGALSDNITGLLRVFEESALNLAHGGKVDDREMITKINSLLDQNKTIAKGLVLMEGKLRGRSEAPEMVPSMPLGSERPRPKPLPSL